MSEQISVKNTIYSLNKFFHKTLILSCALLLTACQSQPTQIAKNSLHPKRVSELPPIQVRKSSDGVQDIEWQIMMIQGKRALFFNQYPGIRLNSVSKLVSGHTGCNTLYGEYQYDFNQKKLNLDLRAGHYSCDKALAQEADLMDALQRVERFQLDGTNLYLLDAKGQRLIQAQPKR